MGGAVVGKLKGGNDVYNTYVMFTFDLKNLEKICVNSDWVLVQYLLLWIPELQS